MQAIPAIKLRIAEHPQLGTIARPTCCDVTQFRAS